MYVFAECAEGWFAYDGYDRLENVAEEWFPYDRNHY